MLMNLPEDLLCAILKTLPQNELLGRVSKLNKYFYALSHSSLLWRNVYLDSIPLDEFIALIDRKVIGPHTLYLTGRPKLMQRAWKAVMTHCPNLRTVTFTKAKVSNVLCDPLPTIRSLSLNGIIPDTNKYYDLISEKFAHNLTHLDMSDCSWVFDSFLEMRLLSSGRNLRHLNLTNCYRVGLGAPIQVELRDRLDRLVEILGQCCPDLISLNLSGVLCNRKRCSQVSPALALITIVPNNSESDKNFPGYFFHG
ncbi:hypothetical protein Ciccas_004886 [Cichlidogyrus casuarinus]|uniref:F-box domain-containing protein n=1 Tax=Cichlidogyrus casuarinus TaxID=1844966 RepID=A0ABD2QB51_9PLAT